LIFKAISPNDSLNAVDLYLPGGLPWRHDPLGSYLNTGLFQNLHLYAVIYPRNLSFIDNLISFPSPPDFQGNLNDSFPPELVCVLLYLRWGGFHARSLIQSFAFYCHFAPLLVDLSRFFNGDPIDGHWLLAVTTSLNCLFTGILDGPIRILESFAFIRMQYAVDTPIVKEYEYLRSFCELLPNDKVWLWLGDLSNSSFGVLFGRNQKNKKFLEYFIELEF
jgi:hypothetical protein